MECFQPSIIILFIILYTLYFIPQTVNAAAPTNGLVGYWNFDEGTGNIVNDTSGNNNNGTINGASWVGGKVGGALEFDGVDDYVSFSNTIGLNFNTYTISFWIKPNTGFSGTVFRLSNSTSNTQSRSKYEIRVTSSGITFITGDGATVDSDSFFASIPADSWSLVTCSLDGSNLKTCNLNGSVISSSANNVDISLNSPIVSFIGTNKNSAGNNFYEGLLDEIRIYNTALSVQEILDIYSEAKGTSGGTTPPPAGDTDSPSAPTILTTSSISSSQINLSWNASIDNVGVTGYRIYRNSVQIATSDTNSYSDTSLTASTQYSYTIRAYDAAGNLSTPSAQLTISTLTESTPPTGSSGTCTSVSQYGIEWIFDKAYTCGQFANGDYWVLGPVVITRITPDFDGNNNGWEVNPVVSGGQGFQSTCDGGSFNSSLVPNLPYTAQGGRSIVKTIGLPGSGTPCLRTASVLTIVGSIPPGNGTYVFRPPYIGTQKPYYYLSQLKTSLLPSFTPVANMPTIQWVTDRFKRVQLDHKTGSLGRAIHPLENMPDYGADIGRDNGDGVLRLMMNDSIQSKMPALIAYVQFGIDQYYSILLGQTWAGGGGHRPGHRIPAAFASIMLADSAMRNNLNSYSFFHEDILIVQKSFQNVWLYGNDVVNELQYWQTVATDSGYRSRIDPYGFIDGGTYPGGPYQDCCNSQPWKGEILATYLMPLLQTAWNNAEWQQLASYTDRWVNSGVWAQPDPCSPYDGNFANYGITFGPDSNRPGMCILDSDLAYYSSPTDFACKIGQSCGRFPNLHGGKIDGGSRASLYQRSMWNTYRPTYFGTSSIAGDLNLDHIVNSLDFSLLNSKWYQSYSAYDLFADGIINSLDYVIMSINWLKTW